jgi:triosephosphate isomerase
MRRRCSSFAGSLKPGNATALIGHEKIDGASVGGASL